MASFTTRVVLHDADWPEYAKLYELMAASGFTDEIASDTGKVYKMPDAEYDWQGDATVQQVRDLAKAAANAVRKKNAVFVTKSAGRSWSGLEEA